MKWNIDVLLVNQKSVLVPICLHLKYNLTIQLPIKCDVRSVTVQIFNITTNVKKQQLLVECSSTNLNSITNKNSTNILRDVITMMIHV